MRRNTMRVLRRTVVLLGAGLLLALPGVTQGPVLAAPPDPQDDITIFNRDVFETVGSTLRNPDGNTSPTAPLFNVAGVNLDITWGQWMGASATSTARVTGKDTDVRISLQGLVPNGVYSVFYLTIGPDSENPLCPGVERSLPVVSTDKTSGPDASSFIANKNGSADYRGTIPGDPSAAMQFYVSIIYHFDGGTYHPLPNKGEFLTQGRATPCRSSFGEDAMRQLLILQ